MTIASSTLLAHRRLFPALTTAKAYFNYGGQGALPQPALDRLSEVYTQLQEIGPFSLAAGLTVKAIVTELRETMAAALGVTPNTIALTENVSAGCNVVLGGIPWRSGDGILISDCEHPSVIATVDLLRARFGVTIQHCSLLHAQSPEAALEAIVGAITPQTRLIVLSHVLWNTGFCLPLAEVIQACRSISRQKSTLDNPLRILIDGAQSVGLLPVNLADLDVDFYGFTGHKWWCGPEGVGGLYIHPEALAELVPLTIGWRGITLNEEGLPNGWKPGAARFEVATSAYPLYAALATAIATHDRWGTAQDRSDRILGLSESLWTKLQHCPGVTSVLSQPPRSGLVSFRWDGSPTALVQQLEAEGMLLRTLASPHCVRACVHYLTLESEIDRLVEKLFHP
jgi:L-cysteine/cystine lyase